MLGLVEVELTGEALTKVNGPQLFPLLVNIIDSYYLNEQLYGSWVEPQTLNIGISFDESSLTLNLNPPLEKLTAEERRILSLQENKENAVTAAPLSGAITVRAENFWAADALGGDYFLSSFDSFLNYRGFVLENQSSYQSNQDREFYRGDTRLVKDFHESSIRTQLGDVDYQTIGYQTLRPVGGFNIGRNFNLNPYRTPYPQFSRDFIVKTRSRVTYFVNGQLVKSEHLYPGRYSVRDVPLVNGINTIIVEIEDDLGRKEILQFQQTTSINLLNKGESKFDLTVGRPFEDQLKKREYSEDGQLSSGFFQYGLSQNFTYAGYLQNFTDFNLLGLESTYASAIGNFSLGAAYGAEGEVSGSVVGLGYNLSVFKPENYATHHLNLRFELRQNEFIQTFGASPSRIKNLTSIYYSFPVLKTFTWGVGAHYGQKNERGISDRQGIESSLNIRVNSRINATFYAARTKDEMKIKNDLAYLMVNISFPENNQYVTGYVDVKSDTQRLTYVKDNLNQLNTFKGTAVVENSRTQMLGDADLIYNAKLANLGAHLTGAQFKNDSTHHHRFSLKAQSSLVFAKNDQGATWAISRPINSSFALFAPNTHLEDQKFSVKSTSPFSEGISDFQGKTVFVNLLPYQYREVTLDPSELEVGYSLGDESFVLFPSYKSGHLIYVGAPGQVSVRGSLLSEGKSLSLRTGFIIDQAGKRSPFFTNRSGRFLMENLVPGVYQLETDSNQLSTFKIQEKSRGLIDIGELEVR